MSWLDAISSGLTAGTQGAGAYLEGQRKGREEEDKRARQMIADLRQKRLDDDRRLMDQAQIGNLKSLAEDRLKPLPPRNIDPLSSEGIKAALERAKGEAALRPVTPNNYTEIARHNKATEELARGRARAGGVQSARLRAVYQKQSQTLDNLKDAIATYRTQLKGSGIEVMPGTNKSLLTGSYANLKLLAKEAANLGALTGPDVKILEELFNDPATLGSGALNVLQLGRRSKGLEAQLDQYESIISGNRSRLEQNYQQQAGSVASGVDETKQLSPADAAKARIDPSFRKWAIANGYEVP